ncbi:ABC-three component system protein [Arcanobacterium canis]
MELSDLFQFIYRATSYNDDGGGEFLLTLSDASLQDEKRGSETNLLYRPDKPQETPAQRKSSRDARQRWYTGADRQLPKNIARFWRRNFDSDSCMEFLDRRIPQTLRSDYREVLANNGFDVALAEVIPTLKDLLITGLEQRDSLQPIADRAWDSSLISATAPQMAVDYVAKPKISELSPDQIKVVGRTLHLGDFRIELVQSAVPEKLHGSEGTYTDQLIRVLCGRLGIRELHSELENAGGQDYQMFQYARQCFYLAESLRMTLINGSVDGEEEFQRIKDDLYAALLPTYMRPHADAYTKLWATLEQANQAQLNVSHLTNTQGLFSNQQRQGATHMLVNDKRIKWVDDE